jgi:hypothetical protein
VSDPVQPRHLGAVAYGNLSVDTHPPSVTFTCGPSNATVRPTNGDVVCVSCGRESEESALGCSVYYREVRPGPMSPAPRVCTRAPGSLTECSVRFLHRHEDVVLVEFWAVDAAGNVGSPVVLTWTVDSFIPITIWPEVTYGQALSNVVAPEYELSCSRSGCRFSYSLDGAPLAVVGGDSVEAEVDTVVVSGIGVDTWLGLGVSKVTNASVSVVELGMLYNGRNVSVTAASASTFQVTACSFLLMCSRAWSCTCSGLLASKSSGHELVPSTTM